MLFRSHISLVSGWQGDVVPTSDNQTIKVPIAHNPDGSPVTGLVLARFADVAAGTNTVTIRLSSMGNTPPVYQPATLDQPNAALTIATSENAIGVKQGAASVSRSGWAFADCRRVPFPGTPDPTRLCLLDGFDPRKLYELTYTAKDPLVLGIGLAATRDIVSFSGTVPKTQPARPTRSPEQSSTPSRSATRSRATSSRRSSISDSTRTSRARSSGTARFRASPRVRRR